MYPPVQCSFDRIAKAFLFSDTIIQYFLFRYLLLFSKDKYGDFDLGGLLSSDDSPLMAITQSGQKVFLRWTICTPAFVCVPNKDNWLTHSEATFLSPGTHRISVV